MHNSISSEDDRGELTCLQDITGLCADIHGFESGRPPIVSIFLLICNSLTLTPAPRSQKNNLPPISTRHRFLYHLLLPFCVITPPPLLQPPISRRAVWDHADEEEEGLCLFRREELPY